MTYQLNQENGRNSPYSCISYVQCEAFHKMPEYSNIQDVGIFESSDILVETRQRRI